MFQTVIYFISIFRVKTIQLFTWVNKKGDVIDDRYT
ncbi:hypothetical protein HBHAL_2582 [Halobacillus halophilus DSM 2266]|uniref:Uncharacterized protein n=1 Tax=Halobacillus halophilus (strain ATCC 35676 / DSM 2266 / JCM 20832 / KCTC 3685 / LMG 17431 / NBRC 102448 / NCIMB 2269) TaxID=866895 RepID=I0JLA8_HALH3|nr:hypothetical protein HBHAL_2582 [Halobacillus halophilus DSM 2266]